MDSLLYIYNSLSGKKEKFIPLRKNLVSIYVCGPTVYDHCHVGHAKSYISFDVVVKWLRILGYKTKYIQNITDVGHLVNDADAGDDKVQKKAIEENVDPMEISQYYTRSFYKDMDALLVDRPNIAPIASGHILEQIELIKQLIEKGYAYEKNGSVYFKVSSFKEYGKLSKRTSQSDLETGHRIAKNVDKQHPSDFSLWKKADPNHIMRWSSPWGIGYPGWHIECSAMAMKYLGHTIDIHGGGIENKFPHHECEIAQSEAITGKPFVRYWMHNNMITINQVKMGKSLGNFVTIRNLLLKFDPISIRFFILQSHYRSPLNFSNDAISSSHAGRQKLNSIYAQLNKLNIKKKTESTSIDIATYVSRFHKAMNDDFNTPIAISVLFDLAKNVSKELAHGRISTKDQANIIKFLDTYAGEKCLGILSRNSQEMSHPEKNIEKIMKMVLEIREKARIQKNFHLSDLIRSQLEDINVEIRDKKEGSTWRFIKK